ncbi:MAG TPA: SH3 domain-containing protein [Anaerolineaceae bacterium]
MAIPPGEPVPSPEIPPSIPPSLRRRHRRRRLFVPPAGSERAEFMEELAETLAPSLDFLLFALASGVIFGVAIFTDAPALFLLVALIAPFMAPLLAIALAAVSGSPRFFFANLGYFLIGSAVIFMAGAAVGLVSRAFPAGSTLQLQIHASTSWADFLLLTVSASLAALLLVRNPRQKPLVASVGVAYELFLPLGAAGFGIATGSEGLFPQALGIFGVHLLWTVLVMILVYMLLGIRPLGCLGYLIEAGLLLITLFLIGWLIVSRPDPKILSGNPPMTTAYPGATSPVRTPSLPLSLTITSTPTPVPTQTPTLTPLPPTSTPTATNTLIPSPTATQTLPPQATPVWAKVASPEGNGIVVRAEPRFDALITHSLFNGVLVILLPETVRGEGATWVKIRTADGKEGWVVRSLLSTATPAP